MSEEKRRIPKSPSVSIDADLGDSTKDKKVKMVCVL